MIGRTFYKKTAWFTGIIFVFLLCAPIYSYQSHEENAGTQFIEEGEQLFIQNKYEQALPLFEKAGTLIQDSNILSGLYLKIAYAYFKLNKIPKSEEWLRNLFELDIESEANMDKFETEFSMVYKKIKAEYWFSVKTKTGENKKEERKIIEKFSPKPKKKKTKLIPILLVAGVAIAAVVMAVLIWQQEDDLPRGLLKVFNHTNYFISVNIGTLYRNCAANSSVSIYLEIGTHQVELSGQGQSRMYTVNIEENETSVISFNGFDE